MLTCARISFIVSLACTSPRPSSLSRRNSLTWRKGSVMPPTSCSGLKPVETRFLRCLTSSPVPCGRQVGDSLRTS